MKKLFTILLILFPLLIYSQDDWQVDPVDYEYSMIVTGVVSIADSIYDDSDGVIVGAFAGDESICVGKAEARYYSKVKKYRLSLMIYSNESKKVISLKAYVPGCDSICSISTTYDFEIDANYGNYVEPVVWEADVVTRQNEFKSTSLELYPNPASNWLTVSPYYGQAVTLFDASGKAILVPEVANGESLRLDVSALRSGIYLLRLQENDRSSIRKIVVH